MIQPHSYIFILLFSIFLFCFFQARAQQISYNLEADKTCFEIIYKEALTGEKLTVEEFENVWPICIRAAESGAAGSQYLVGMVYLEQDREKAIFWLAKAAENGHSGARAQLEKMGIIEREEE